MPRYNRGMQTDTLLTIEEAAARRSCSATTIWRRIRLGELESHRVLARTVVRIEDVDALTIPAPRNPRWTRKQAEESQP